MSRLSVPDRRAEADRFDFRRVHPRLRFGTASDRYAGWLDTIYPRDVWAGQVSTRQKKVGRESFTERLLPIASVEDYFLHFNVLELDFLYYRPLLKPDGRPESNLFVLQQYADHAPANARFVVKAPRQFVSRKLPRRSGGRMTFEDNEGYLDAAGFTRQFVDPLRDALGVKLAGVIVEQEYVRVRESPPPEAVVGEWDGFFRDVPREVSYHLEIRSEHLLTPGLAAWMDSAGIGRVFSHWTWLPTLRDQWMLAGETFSARNREAIVRLLNPRDMKYDEAFALAYPFTEPVPALSETGQARRMIDESAALMYKAVESDVTLNLIANNRAWGSSPHLAQTLAHRFLDVADRRGQ
ncbi:MAG: DUF72 domain-containing protein [Bacteroidota bacterium]